MVGFGDKAIDGGLEIDNASEDAPFQPLLGKFGEEALDGVKPRAGGRREVEGEARMSIEPLTHLGMLVGSVVVEDHVHDLSDRYLRLNGVEEADELLVTMALHTSSDDPAFEDIESGEQRCNRGSSLRLGPSSSAGQAGCDQGPGFATFRRPRGRWRGRAG